MSSMDPSGTLPWVEKYRPNSMEDLVAHEEIISTIARLIDAGRLPHLLLYGPPGTGKTSTILAVAKRLYGKHYRSMILELNASDDRGIDVVRDQIKDFAGTRKLFSQGVKLVVLDEADHMTNDAQFALRRVIERYSANTRFCIICNYVSKIIPALQSRCTRFRFSPLSRDQMVSRTRQIIEAERINVTPDGLEAVLRLSEGDMRKVLNVLQASSMATADIDADAIYACTGRPRPSDVATIVDALLNSPFQDAFDRIMHLQVTTGFALTDVITEVSRSVMLLDLPKLAKMALVERLATIEYNLSFATNERLQLGALVGAFIEAREAIAATVV